MKNFLKLIIVIGLAITMGRYVLTQTTPGQSYYTDHLQHDIERMRSQLIVRLGGSPQIEDRNGIDEKPSIDTANDIGYPQYDAGGKIIVTPRTLEQRLQYYKDSKEQIWESN